MTSIQYIIWIALVNKDLMCVNTSHGLLKHSYKGATHSHTHAKYTYIKRMHTHTDTHSPHTFRGLATLVSCCTMMEKGEKVIIIISVHPKQTNTE